MRSITLKDKRQIVLNSDIELGEQEGNGKGRYFMSRFIEPGIAHYEELGDILITKETLNKFIQTMVGVPVIIDHEDVTDKNVDKLRVGTVSKVWFNEFDGYFYCEGILTDKDAVDLVKNKGWNVSCAYSFVADETKKQHNGKDIDMEFTDGEFLHLAIVKNPRYEGANIVVNKNDDDLEWITVKGNHIPIKKGQSKEEAIEEFIEKQSEKRNQEKLEKIEQLKKEYPIGSKFTTKDPYDKEEHTVKEITKGPVGDIVVVDEKGYQRSIEKINPKDKSGDNEERIKSVNIKGADGNALSNFTKTGSYKDGDKLKRILSENKNKTLGEIKDLLNKSDITYHNWEIADGFESGDKISDYEEVNFESDLGVIQIKDTTKAKANNSIGEITMAVLNELTDFIKKVVKNEKDDEMKEVKNEDKRKLIDEVGGILKGKVDDEIIRTVIGKLEKIAYEPSEDSKADNEDDDKEKEAKNKCKNEDDKEEDKKADNEDDEEDDEDVTKNEDDEEDKEEKAENKKVKNSMKDIVMGGKGQVQEQKLYISRKERLEEGNKY